MAHLNLKGKLKNAFRNAQFAGNRVASIASLIGALVSADAESGLATSNAFEIKAQKALAKKTPKPN